MIMSNKYSLFTLENGTQQDFIGTKEYFAYEMYQYCILLNNGNSYFKVVYIGLSKTTSLWLISSSIYSMRSDKFIRFIWSCYKEHTVAERAV